MSRSNPDYHLVRPIRSAPEVSLDADQQRVVDHAGGPLLVLAGPGTGKTTTLVEAIADRIERRGVRPDRILALTFSRKAAEQLRDRVAARVGHTMSASMSSTFHSFAYGLIRQWSQGEAHEQPLRLLSAAEQDVVLAELLTREAESVRWPGSVSGGLGTRGFAGEVAQVLGRAQGQGLGFEALRELGEREQVPEFVAAAALMEQYDDIAASRNLLDYSGLIASVVRILQDPDNPAGEAVRRQYSHVLVDEYQDTDLAQVALLRAIAGDGRELVVVGDPHQSIYAFRGAQVRGILEFPDRFRRADGRPAQTIVLGTTRRFGERIAVAARRVADRLPLPASVPTTELERFARPQTQAPDPGRVEVWTYDTERAEAEQIADLLRRAHLHDKVAWSDMAVLVRSGKTTIPGLRRALAAAGVPVDVASDDTPMVREPAVAPLLDALAAAIHLDQTDPAAPGYLDSTQAHALLASPLAGLDASDVRTLARRLRTRETEAATADGRTPRRSPELLREAVVDPAVLADLAYPSDAEVKALELARLLAGAAEALRGGATVEQALWLLWSGTAWPRRLQEASRRGGSAGWLAHRDLDAVVTLFEAAARAEEQVEYTSAESFLRTLRAQQIPADTLAERGVRGESVRLLTAHRAKGLEWPLVVVAHVQEDAWPDLRRRATLLRADRIGSDGLVPPTTVRELLADERRLFYVACTRATRRLVVTAVASTDEDGEQRSRFCEELVGDPDRIQHVSGRPHRPLSMAGMIAALRRAVADESEAEPVRAAAARRLAWLADEHRSGRLWAPGADPDNWWGTQARSRSTEPLRPAGEPPVISASTLTSIANCPAQWFLQREAAAEQLASQAQGFGNVVHAVADRIGRDEIDLDRDPAVVVDELMTKVDQVWGQIPFRTPWAADQEREVVHGALTRFLERHRAAGRRLVGTEERLTTDVTLSDGQVVRLHGYADRLELDADDRVVVIDLKTGKYPPTAADVAVHPQLGLYQLAVEHGAVAGYSESGGAELWQLRKPVRGKLNVQRQEPQQPDEEGVRPIERQLTDAATRLRTEDFPARPGGHCDRCEFARFCPAQSAGTVIS